MKFNPSMIDNLANFTSSVWTMNVLAPGTDDITHTASLALSPLSNSVSNPLFTNQSMIYSICNNDLEIILNNLNYEE